MLDIPVDVIQAAEYVAQAEQVMDLFEIGDIKSGCISLAKLLTRVEGRDAEIHEIMKQVEENKCR